MKATGIVRKIDDLGRVVIPKEIRKTLRIREGDPLEIFTDTEGEIILKKYSPIGELGDFASEYAESLHKASGHITCIADKESIIAVSGIGSIKKELLEKALSQDMERVINEKNIFIAKSNEDLQISIIGDESIGRKYSAQIVSPIISEGDPIGAVMLLSVDPNIKMGEIEAKLAQTAATFLGKHLEQ